MNFEICFCTMSNTHTKTNVISTSVVILSLVLIGFYSSHRSTFEEWDGVLQYAAGTSYYETGTYAGWASHFWPPLQPMILALGDPFSIGRIVSFLSVLIILYSSFGISRIYTGRVDIGLVTMAMVVSVSPLWALGIQVENHALETAGLLAGLYAILKYYESKTLRYLIGAAIIIGTAGLTRYTSYSIAALITGFLFFKRDKNPVMNALVFVVSFSTINVAWWYSNFVQNGSPLHTWQYLNLGSSLYQKDASEWWWRGQEEYENLADVVSAFPHAVMSNFLSNLHESFELITTATTPYIVLSNLIFGLTIYAIWCAIVRRQRFPMLLICSAIIFTGLCAFVFVFTAALMPSIVLYCIVLVVSISSQVPKGNWIVVILALINLPFSIGSANTYLATASDDHGQLTNSFEVTKTLVHLEVDSTTILASVHPARALNAKTSWIMPPFSGFESVCELLSYDFGPRVLAYIPRMPVSLRVSTPDILVIDPWYASVLAQNDVTFPEHGRCDHLNLEWSTRMVSDVVRLIIIKTRLP